MSIKTYTELITLPTFKERFEYLKIGNKIGDETFGFSRYLNQTLYSSYFWKEVIRPKIITRDMGFDLGVKDFNIIGRIVIHHMNPITIEDLEKETDFLYNPEYLICVSESTHRAIHYSDDSILNSIGFVERTKNDTCLWRKK